MLRSAAAPLLRRRALPSRGLATKVYMWGDGSENRLGFAVKKEGSVMPQQAALVPQLLPWEPEAGVAKVALGQAHSAAVTKDGALYTWGRGKHGELGHGSKANAKTPTRVEALAGVSVVDVSCGAYHTVAVDDGGRAYAWGIGGGWRGVTGVLGHGDKEGRDEPTLIASFAEDDVEIVRAEAGYKHTAFMTSLGDVYCCGTGEYGRLGNGASFDQLVPGPVEFMEPDLEVSRMTAGGSFTLIEEASEGKLYAWGKNDQGQLGQGASMSMDIYSMENIPVTVDNIIGDKKMVDIAAGHSHCVALDDEGAVWLWGMKLHLEPFCFTEFGGKSIIKVAAGQNFSAALSADGRVYTMGHGNSWSLGHGEKKTIRQPQEVIALTGLKVVDIACGERHMAVVVVEEGEDAVAEPEA